MHSYEALTQTFKNEKLPYAVVDLEAFDRNLALMRRLAGSHKLRVATKSIRVPELLKRVAAAGGPFQGFMCYAAEEAKELAALGLDDFLIAYPTLQKSDLLVLRELHENGKKIALVVDSGTAVQALSKVMFGVAKPFRVLIDIDVSWRPFGGLMHFGVRRSPVRTPSQALLLLQLIQAQKPLQCVGAMAYEAQIAGLTDRNPFKWFLNPIAKVIRKISVDTVREQRQAIAAVLKKNGVEIETFNGGGTGSLNFASQEPWLTELSAGSGLLCSQLFDYYSNVRFEPACFFALQVVRASDEGLVTCLGGGYVASGEAGRDRLPKPYLPEGLSLTAIEGAGEVQTPVNGAKNIELGAPIFFRHAKAGELGEHFNEYLLLSNGKITGRAKTYRGLGWKFF